jgi:hypothetical protein
MLALREFHRNDASLSVLLAVQFTNIFIILPLVSAQVLPIRLADVGLLVFTILCAICYVRQVYILAILLCSMLAIVLGPTLWHFMAHNNARAVLLHESISLATLCFNTLITGLVVQKTFAIGEVTRHRILGAVLVYLNVALIFSAMYDLLDTAVIGAIQDATGRVLTRDPGARIAEFIYFSFTTITTCGYGDLIPVHPFARSLSNLEAVFGQIFPATFVARLVALHISHGENR